MQSDDDKSLMLKVKNGDRDAFDELVERHRIWAMNMLYRMVGNTQDAEDLTQDAFMRVYAARNRYRPDAKFTTWFNRILVNLALNHRRRRPMVRLDDSYYPSDVAAPDDKIAENETIGRIWDEMRNLPDRQRVALVLTRIEGMSYAEAADAMGVSIESVRALISRARETLRIKLRTIINPIMDRGADNEMR